MVAEIIKPGEPEKPRFKVATYALMCEIHTVYANSPEDAIDKVGKGMGVHAGREGPTMVGGAALPFASPAAKDFIPQWMATIQQMQAELARNKSSNESGNIIVPKLKPPPGIIAKG